MSDKKPLKGRITSSFQINKDNDLKFNYKNSGLFEVSINVMAENVEANRCIFTEGSIERSFKTLFYKPLLTEWKPYDDGQYRLGTHGGQDIWSDNGYQHVRTTFGIGTIPKQEIRFVNIPNSENSETYKYLNVKAYIWTDEYPEIADYIYKNGANQSMEILIEDYDYDAYNRILIKDFKFTGLCALNKDDGKYNVLPAFELADIKPASKLNNDFNTYENQMSEINAKFEDFVGKINDKIELLFSVKQNEDEEGQSNNDDTSEDEQRGGEMGKTNQDPQVVEKELKDFSIDEIMDDERVKEKFKEEKESITSEYENKISEKDTEINELNEKFADYSELKDKVSEFEKTERLSKFDAMVSEKFKIITSDNEEFVKIRELVEAGKNDFEDNDIVLQLKALAFDIAESLTDEPETDENEDEGEVEKEQEDKKFANAGIPNRPKKHNVDKSATVSSTEYNSIFK